MKKIFKYFATILMLFIWTYIYLIVSSGIFIFCWNFNILSSANWNVVYRYWESGGVIHTWKDYLLLLFLGAYLPCWYFGWRYFRNIQWLKVLMFPIVKYNQYIINKYGADSKRIVLKNMGVAGMKIEEEIELKVKPKAKIETDAEVNSIRAAVAEKINSVKHE